MLRLTMLCLLLLGWLGQAHAHARTGPPGRTTQANRITKDDKTTQADRITNDKDAGDDGFEFNLGNDKPAGDPRLVQAPAFGDRLNLSTPWLFKDGPGDYSSPNLDDSGWTPLDTAHNNWKRLFRQLNEIWYRVHVRLVPGTHDLALTVAEFGGSYRVYVNGNEIGGHGILEGRGEYLEARSATFPIPDRDLAPDTVITIHALVGRVDRATFTLGDGLTSRSAVYLGPANVLYRDQQTYFANGMSEGVGALTLWAVLLALALALAFYIHGARVYWVLAVYAGAHLLGMLLGDWATFHYHSRTDWVTVWSALLLLLSELALLEFLRLLSLFGRRRLLVVIAVFYAVATLSLGLAAAGFISFTLYASLLRTAHILYRVMVIVMVYLGVRRKQQDAYVLASVLGFYVAYWCGWWLLGHVVFFYAPLNVLAQAFTANVRPGPMGNVAIASSFLGVVLVRTLRIVRERATIANEIEAARTMQQLLLGKARESTPGFLVESVYLPAGEVGGDFFLVAPCAENGKEPSLTVIVGDVSGKGLRAAMRVSMILGVLRREPSREPAAMLRGLNEALAGEGDTGFTTACCVRLAPDGHYTVANAGHISPYVGGAELQTAPALPLGLAGMEPGETYPLLHGKLQAGQRLVLMSDGVAEARSAKGELYGFERLAPLTLRPAQEIAETAQRFGQDDDITVVTIGCVARTTNAPPPPMPAKG